MSTYEAGTRIETRQGRTGTADGTADQHGNPGVQFDDGEFGTFPAQDIKGTIDRFGAVHRFGDTRQAYDLSQCRDEIHDGDVLWVPSEGIAGVLYRAWPVAVNEPHDVQHGEFHGWTSGIDALAAAEGGRYAVSVQRARSLLAGHISSADGPQPEHVEDLSWPQPVQAGLAAALPGIRGRAPAAGSPAAPAPGSTPGR